MSRHKGQIAADDGRMELYEQGYNDIQIAEKLYLDRSTIWSWRKRRGLPPNEQAGGVRRCMDETSRGKDGKFVRYAGM
jgi:uncharacterized protein YjcR